MNNKATNLLWLSIGFLLGLVLGYFAFANVVQAKKPKPTPTPPEPCCEWTDWIDVADCEPVACGTTDGTKLQERYCQSEECEYSCPIIHWEYDFGRIHREFDVEYIKSEDPTECHRPSKDQLEDWYDMWKTESVYFTQHNPETMDAIAECETTTLETEQQEVKCEAELVPCDEPQPSPTPTPTSTPVPEKGLSEAGAPQCTDPRPVQLPANPLVWRNGGTAIVQWQPTEGNTANIYYYQVQNPDNSHAVRDTQNDGYVEIEGLSGLDWTFGVQQSNGCAGGDIVWIEDGMTPSWVLFTP